MTISLTICRFYITHIKASSLTDIYSSICCYHRAIFGCLSWTNLEIRGECIFLSQLSVFILLYLTWFLLLLHWRFSSFRLWLPRLASILELSWPPLALRTVCSRRKSCLSWRSGSSLLLQAVIRSRALACGQFVLCHLQTKLSRSGPPWVRPCTWTQCSGPEIPWWWSGLSAQRLQSMFRWGRHLCLGSTSPWYLSPVMRRSSRVLRSELWLQGRQRKLEVAYWDTCTQQPSPMRPWIYFSRQYPSLCTLASPGPPYLSRT